MVSCLGSLVQSCCGEGGALQTNVTGACGEHSQCSGHTGFAPAHSACAFPSTLLRLQAALRALSCVRFQFSGSPQKRRLSWACVLCLPHPSSSGSQEPDELTLPGYREPYPLRGPSLSFPHAGWVRLVSVLRSWPLAATLPADVNHPESQEVFG